MLQVHKLGVIVLASFLASGVANAGTITRGTKASGGTAFVTGYTASASEVNTDFDRLYDLVNGNLDTNNLSATAGITSGQIANDSIINEDVNTSAGIVYSKFDQTAAQQDADIVDDYSTDDAEQATESSPGTSDSTTLATNLEEELEQIRRKIHELTVGSSASAVAAAGGTAALTSWIDGPIRGHNLLYNGGFDIWNSSTPDAGNGWSVTASPADTVQSEALVEAQKYGDGNGINVIAGAADTNEGIQQTLDGLKAEGKYLAIVFVRDDVGTCSLGTSGADTNELTVVSDDSGDWQVLSGTFQADAVPSDVTIQLLAVGNSNDCVFESAGVYEINADPVPSYQIMVDYDDSSTDDTIDNLAFEDIDGIGSLQVTPPTSGWKILVSAVIGAEYDAGGGAARILTGRIQQNCAGGGAATVALTSSPGRDTTGSYGNYNVALEYVNMNPTAGETCVYTLEAIASNAASIIANGEGTISSFRLMAIPPR